MSDFGFLVRWERRRERKEDKGEGAGIGKERLARPAPFLILGCDCVILGYSSHFRTMRGNRTKQRKQTNKPSFMDGRRT